MTTYYVHSGATGADNGTSWEDAFSDIEVAIGATTTGDALWVKTGIFYPAEVISIPEGVSVYGGFDWDLSGTDGSTSDRPWTTIINGGGTIQGVLMQDGALIDGFVIEDCVAANGAGIGIVGSASGYYYGPELLVDGNMNAVGTAAWGDTNATLSKITGWLDVRADDHVAGYAYQNVMTPAHNYYCTGMYKAVHGTVSVLDGAVHIFTDITPSAWTAGAASFTASSTSLRLWAYDLEVFGEGLFENFSLKEVIAYAGTISATVRNCWIRNCAATADGGGIYVSDTADVVIDAVTISNCTAGGDGAGIAFANTNTNSDVTDCEIYGCVATTYGGGIAVQGDDATNDYTILRCRIHDNESTDKGGGVYVGDEAGSDLRLTRCVIADNDGAPGGVYLATGVVTVTGCTCVNDESYELQRAAGTLTVVNSIVRGSSTPVTGTATITYSNVQGGYAGTGNVDVDPKFVGSGTHKYALNGLSTTVDGANAGATYHTSTDILGEAMYDHAGQANAGAGVPAYVDMGAYEYQGTPQFTMPMSNYYISFATADAAATTDNENFWMFAALRLPEMPQMFKDNTVAPRNVRHQISSEIEVDEADSTLEEMVYVDHGIAAYRVYDGTPIGTPSRSVDYEADYQSAYDPHVAEDKRSREGEVSTKVPTDVTNMTELPNYFRYVFISMQWRPLVAAMLDVMKIYNVDINQIHDLAYAYEPVSVEAHGGTTIMAPDVPLSAYHMRRLLSESLLKMIYEAIYAQSIPVFGVFAQVVV